MLQSRKAAPMKKQLLIALVAAPMIAACQQSEPEVVEQYDPMEEELANAAPVDINMVPMAVGSDDYRCKGSNLLLRVDFIRTGDQMTARVTPAGGDGATLTETSPGVYTSEGNTLNGTPQSDTVTFNGASCTR